MKLADMGLRPAGWFSLSTGSTSLVTRFIFFQVWCGMRPLPAAGRPKRRRASLLMLNVEIKQ